MAKRAPLAALPGERAGSAWRGLRASASQPLGMPRGDDLPPPPVQGKAHTCEWQASSRGLLVYGLSPLWHTWARDAKSAVAAALRLWLGGHLGGVVPLHARVGPRQGARVDLAEVWLRDVPAAVGLLSHVRLARCHGSLNVAAVLTYLSRRLPAPCWFRPSIRRRRCPLLLPICQRLLRAECAGRGPAHRLEQIWSAILEGVAPARIPRTRRGRQKDRARDFGRTIDRW